MKNSVRETKKTDLTHAVTNREGTSGLKIGLSQGAAWLPRLRPILSPDMPWKSL